MNNSMKTGNSRVLRIYGIAGKVAFLTAAGIAAYLVYLDHLYADADLFNYGTQLLLLILTPLIAGALFLRIAKKKTAVTRTGHVVLAASVLFLGAVFHIMLFDFLNPPGTSLEGWGFVLFLMSFGMVLLTIPFIFLMTMLAFVLGKPGKGV